MKWKCSSQYQGSRKTKNPPINRLLDVNSVKLCNYFRLSIITLVHCQNASHTYQAIHQIHGYIQSMTMLKSAENAKNLLISVQRIISDEEGKNTPPQFTAASKYYN